MNQFAYSFAQIAKPVYCRLVKAIAFYIVISFLFICSAQAKVIPAACFTDNMVLQQKSNVTLWGTGTPGKSFSVTTSWNNKQYSVATGADGNWKTKVATPSYGGPYTITFDDGDKTVLNNVLIGDVWICSGQSNMTMPVDAIAPFTGVFGKSCHPSLQPYGF